MPSVMLLFSSLETSRRTCGHELPSSDAMLNSAQLQLFHVDFGSMCHPGRPFPHAKRVTPRGTIANGMCFSIDVYLSFAWNVEVGLT